MVGLQTLDLAIGVRVPASQPTVFKSRAGGHHYVAARFVCLHNLHYLRFGREANKDPSQHPHELPASDAGALPGE